MKKQLIQFASWLGLIVLVVMATEVVAQIPPPPMPSGPEQSPIDGGLVALGVAGGAYALKKIRDSRKG